MKRFLVYALVVPFLLAALPAVAQPCVVEFDMPVIDKWVLVNDNVNLRQGPSTSTPRLVYRQPTDGCLDCGLDMVYATTPKKDDIPARARYAPVLGEQGDWTNIYFFYPVYNDVYFSETPWVSKSLTRPAQVLHAIEKEMGLSRLETLITMSCGKYRGLLMASGYGGFDDGFVHLGCEIDDMLVFFAYIPADLTEQEASRETSELQIWSWDGEEGCQLKLDSRFGTAYHLNYQMDLEPTVDLLVKNLSTRMKPEMRILVPFKGNDTYETFIFGDKYTGPKQHVKFYPGEARPSTESRQQWISREFKTLKALYDEIIDASESGNVGTYLSDVYTRGVGIAAALEPYKDEMTAAQQAKFEDMKTVVLGFMEPSEFDDLVKETTGAKQSVALSGQLPFTVGGVSFTMVKVDGGTFTMGATPEQGSDARDDRENPAHQVTLSSYCIGQTEVTQELWQAVMGSNPSKFSGYPQRPVEQVSWDDCQTFITKLNQLTGKTFRLPTEAEWEFAARGGNLSKGYKYAGSNNVDDVAWYRSNSSTTSHPVGAKSPNELDLYDMSGNVYEWCQDWYGDYTSDAQTNPVGPTTGYYRVCRGGYWISQVGYCRVSNRLFNRPSFTDDFLGLRLAL